MPTHKSRTYFFLFLLIGISGLFFAMLWSYLLTIILAAISTGLFYPVYRRLLRRTGDRQTLSSILTILFILLIFGVPLATVLGLLSSEAVHLYNSVDGKLNELSKDADSWLHRFQILELPERFREVEWQSRIADAAKTFSRLMYQSIASISKSAFRIGMLFFVYLFTMYYLFKDGPSFMNTVRELIPLKEEHTDLLVSKFTFTTMATIKGTLLIGTIQGVLAGLMFWILGVGAPVLWGVVMTILSIIPILGSGLVWGPAAVVKIVTGHVPSGIIMLVFGMLVIGTIDNLLRPRLVAREAMMHPLLVFLGIIGGISLFGISGFLIGPVISALFISIWDIYRDEFKEEMESGTFEEGEQKEEIE